MKIYFSIDLTPSELTEVFDYLDKKARGDDDFKFTNPPSVVTPFKSAKEPVKQDTTTKND